MGSSKKIDGKTNRQTYRESRLIYGTMGSHGDSWSVFMGADLVFPASIHLLMSNLPKHSLSRSQRERAEAAPGLGSQARHLSADSSAGADSLASSSVKTLLVVLTLIALWCWHFVLTDASLC